MKFGKEAAEFVTKEFKKPMSLEFEKVYFPYLLFAKKKYIGMYYSKPDKPDKMDSKGIETNRRDACKLVSEVLTKALEIIMIERDTKKAIKYVQNTISDLLQNKIDISLLILTRQLNKGYGEEDSNLVHVQVANKMKKRSPENAPKLGDRVKYLMTTGHKKDKAFTLGDDPLYVIENDIPINYNWYLTNQLTKPLVRIFSPILGGDENTSSILFWGKHTEKVKKSISSIGIARYVVKKSTCLGCHCVLDKKEKIVCKNCETKKTEILLQQIDETKEKEKLFHQVWSTCMNCQSRPLEEVTCANDDCQLFYKRLKIKKEYEEAGKKIADFSF
jgi:DNA polymerase delta subunit 1